MTNICGWELDLRKLSILNLEYYLLSVVQANVDKQPKHEELLIIQI